jgi:hypothetical protein
MADGGSPADRYDLCCRIHADTTHTSKRTRTVIASQSGKSMAPPQTMAMPTLSPQIAALFLLMIGAFVQGRELPAKEFDMTKSGSLSFFWFVWTPAHLTCFLKFRSGMLNGDGFDCGSDRLFHPFFPRSFLH